MADTKDYLTVYKRFFDNFAKTVDPDDQLPVRVAGYRLWDNEIVGETVDWTLQYLSQRNCPPSLLAPITRIVIDEIKQACATQPLALGFKSPENYYLPLKLMQAVTNKVNEVCLRFCDNGRVTTLPPPLQGPLISSCAVKNSRRCMEDRHVILEDFHAFFNIKDTSPASYYAVFDGHAGTDAAIYSVSHLHQFLAESSDYPTDPEKAIKDAFLRTDNLFIEKSNKENLRSGTTAVCALLRQKEKKLYCAWLGDSQAILVRHGQAIKLVNPHKPERQDEMARIQNMGGSVVYWGTWRVNGQLAVSRAIGDLSYKPYVTAEPDVRTVDLIGDEDFLILACDGLWDFVNYEDVVRGVYKQVLQNPADLEAVSQKLVQLSKQHGSTDNITVIVAFLTEPSQLAARAREGISRPWAPTNGPQPSAPVMEAFDFDINTNSSAPAGEPAAAAAPGAAASTNPFETELAAPAVAAQKAAAAAAVSAVGAGLLLDIGGAKDDPFQLPPFNNGHTNGNLYDFLDRSPNGKASAAEEEDDDDDDDSGPETGGGADEKHASLLAKSNPFGVDIELQRQQMSEFDPENEPRHDTPTPPADEVPGVIGLVSDNVAESGEESEDEWDYYKGEPSEKPQEPAVKEQQAKEVACEEQPLKVEESDENMESQLNPNAAEFIPSPTHSKPSMEEILSQSSEVDSLFNNTLSSVNTSTLVETQEKELDKNQKLFSLSQQEEFVNPLAASVQESVEKGLSDPFNESAAFSTKAEFGDESTTSGTDIQKILDASSNIMESSLLGKDFLASQEEISGITLENTSEPSVVVQESIPQQDIVSDFQKEPVHISFELQKEIAPHMESQPERVKVDSEDQSPILESEPVMQDIIDVPENKPDNLELVSNVILANLVPELDDFIAVSNTIPEDTEVEVAVEDKVVTKIEETVIAAESPRIDEVDLLKELDSKSFSRDDVLEFSQTVEKSDLIESAVSPTVFVQNNFEETESKVEVPSQLSESPLSELTDELPVPQESHNRISNEISTPEYEKLEKDIEASEQYHDQFNARKDNIPEDFCIGDSNSAISSDVLLESAHPDRVALLDDACAEPVPIDASTVEDFAQFSNGPLNVSAPAPALNIFDPINFENVPSSISFDLTNPDNFIQSEPAPLIVDVPEVDILSAAPLESAQIVTTTSPFDIEKMETASHDSAFIEQQSDGIQIESPVHIPTYEIAHTESIHNEISESTQAPPPTPLITQLAEGETLSFARDTDNFSEVVEKLSATQQLSEVNGLEEGKDLAFETSEVIQSAVSQQAVEDISSAVLHNTPTDITQSETASLEPTNDAKPIDDQSLTNNVTVAAVAAGGVAAAVATATAAAVSTSDKETKKEVPAKKLAMVSVKDKKTGIEKPKTATKTAVSSRLTMTTTKPKSPTSPVKAPIAQKTAPTRPPSAIPSKPLSKSPATKTATRPLSSVPARTATSTTSKPKPAGSQPLARPASTGVGLAKTRPTSSLEKKTVTNGDVKTALKRPEQLTSRTTTTKLSTRPASAPATKAPVSKTVTSVSTITKTKSPLNGPSKPKPLSVTSTRSVAKVSNEKEIKETANKQISTRTTTSTVRSTTTTMASRTSVTSAPRKIESKVVANGKGPAMKPSSMVKTTTTTSSRISPKKPATTTRLKATKTESIVEKSETVQGSKTVIAMNE